MNTNQLEHTRVGATVKCIRELRGLTQDQLAAAALMSRSQLANIEAGRKSLSARALARISQALAVPSAAIKLAPAAETENAA